MQEKLAQLFRSSPSVLVVANVDTKAAQMQALRPQLRTLGATIFKAKNELIRQTLLSLDDPAFLQLLPCIRYDIFLVFVSNQGDLIKVIDVINSTRQPALAFADLAPSVDIRLEAGIRAYGHRAFDYGTNSVSPVKSLLDAIYRPRYVALRETVTIRAWEQLGMANAVLLNIFGRSPFYYGTKVLHVYHESSLIPVERLIRFDSVIYECCKAVQSIKAVLEF